MSVYIWTKSVLQSIKQFVFYTWGNQGNSQTMLLTTFYTQSKEPKVFRIAHRKVYMQTGFRQMLIS